MARTCDLVLMMLDAGKSDAQKEILERELGAVGIRLNKPPPNIYFKAKTTGGLSFTSTVKQSVVDERMAYNVLHEYSTHTLRHTSIRGTCFGSFLEIHNAEVILREDVSVDEFIDAVVGTRIYTPCLYVYNKIDVLTVEEVRRLGSLLDTVLISCEWRLGLEYLVRRIWHALGLLRVYTKKPGSSMPDFADPLIVRSGATIEHVCHTLHRNLPSIVRYALVWGQSAKHQPQKVGLGHAVADEDVIQIVKRK